MDYTKEQIRHLSYWVEQLKNSKYKKFRFKRLKEGYRSYPRFFIPKDLLDIVELSEFVIEEENRLPLFIGTQFGIYPNKDDIKEFESYNGLFAILGKSLLSGAVAGLGIYSKEGKIAFIPNKEL